MAETLRGSVHENPVRRMPRAQNKIEQQKPRPVEARPLPAPWSVRHRSSLEAWENASSTLPHLPWPILGRKFGFESAIDFERET
jgi:hypothetical protein